MIVPVAQPSGGPHVWTCDMLVPRSVRLTTALAAVVALASLTCRDDALPACGAGGEPRCSELGRRYELGERVSVDVVVAAKLYERGCTLGEQASCEAFGRMYEGDSPALGRSHDAAFEYMQERIPGYEQDCSAGTAEACAVLGDLYLSGLYGLPKDPPRARTFFERACLGGIETACRSLEALSAKVPDVPSKD